MLANLKSVNKLSLGARYLSGTSKYSGAAVAEKKKPEPYNVESDSFVKNLFRGKLNLDTAFPYPLNLSEDRKEMLSMVYGPAKNFLENINNAAQNDVNGCIPEDVKKGFGELGALGILVPEEYEGAGMNNTQFAKLAELIGSNDLALGIFSGAHQSIGYKGILLYGSEAQKKHYLPDLATGRKIAAFALTEPSSGSDANSITTKAELSACGKFYIINGSKIYISNGPFAEIFTVFAKTPIKQEDGSIKHKVSAFIVEKDFGGVTSSPAGKKLGIKASATSEIYFENVKVPKENLIGGEGEGFKVAMNILNNGRFGIPAAMTGSMKYCIQKSIDQANNRVQFGRKLNEFVNVHEKISGMVMRHYVTESILYMLASNMDAGVKDYQLEAAIAKVAASDNAWWVCDEAIQLHGGMGYMSETGLERVLRDIRIFRIFEGANDILKIFVSLTGMNHAGKALQATAKEVKSGGIGTLFGEVMRRATGSTGGSFEGKVDPQLNDSAAKLNSCIAEFGKTVEGLILKHKKGVIERQYEQIRVADAAIDIYSMVCALSRCTYSLNKKAAGSENEVKIVKLFVDQATKRVFDNLKIAASPNGKEIDSITELAKDICANGGLIQQHPIDL
uniref:Very long-chain specific acyl-CoA dehydrogenase, mitochondrial n=1 Tax=Rhabditophanes sp. KR3021 TaxID=114890 RepID=A0AC35TGH4_9BILA